MTTCIPAGTGSLHYSATLGKGQGCRKTSWVSGVTFKRCIQKELSWYIFRNQFVYGFFNYSINSAQLSCPRTISVCLKRVIFENELDVSIHSTLADPHFCSTESTGCPHVTVFCPFEIYSSYSTSTLLV